MKKTAILLFLIIGTFTLLNGQTLPKDLELSTNSAELTNIDTINDIYNFKAVQMSRLEELNSRLLELDTALVKIETKARNNKIISVASAATGLLAIGGYLFFSQQAEVAYDNYKSATMSPDAISYREEFTNNAMVSYVSLGVVGAGTAGVATAVLTSPNFDVMTSEYESLQNELQQLTEKLK